MPGNKRSLANSTSDSFFEQLFSIANASNLDRGFLKSLKGLKNQMLSEDKGSVCKAAKEFTLDEAVEAFGLEHSSILIDAPAYVWKIQAFPEVNTFEPSACISKVSPYVIEPCNDKGPY